MMKTLITNADSAKIEVELPFESFKKLLAFVPPSDVNTFFENCVIEKYEGMHDCKSRFLVIEHNKQWRGISSYPTSKEEAELLHKKMKKVLTDYRKKNSKVV